MFIASVFRVICNCPCYFCRAVLVSEPFAVVNWMKIKPQMDTDKELVFIGVHL